MVPALIAAGLQILDKFIPDPKDRAEAEQELRRALKDWDQSQMEVNKAEAAHENIFVAGWRPFIGWVCGLAFAWHFVAQPVILVVLLSSGVDLILPEFDMSQLMTVLLGLLGLGGLRTYEKFKGVNSKHG